jgi:hypothetical protein
VIGVLAGPGVGSTAETSATADTAETPNTAEPVDAAFFESFDAPAPAGGGNRNGDLSTARFSVARWRSELSFDGNQHVTAGPPLPDDVRIVDGRAVVAVGSQNYGDTSVRIARPLDIAGRTGTVHFDTSLYVPNGLWGWPTVYFLADPYSAPSYHEDNSDGALPAEGLGIHFQRTCQGSRPSPMAAVRTYTGHVETTHHDEAGRESWCPDLEVTTAEGLLNRVELRLSTSRLEIWASDASADGETFGPLRQMWSGTIALTFTRGFVYLGAHNHATLKYGGPEAWTTYWDNVGFDGPVVPTTRVSQVPNSGPRTFGYPLPNGADGGAGLTLALPGVDLAGASGARLVLDLGADHLTNRDYTEWRLNYRFNGATWHAATLDPAQYGTFGYSWSIPVEVSEVLDGDNTVELSGTGFFDGYQPYVANIDLVVQ